MSRIWFTGRVSCGMLRLSSLKSQFPGSLPYLLHHTLPCLSYHPTYNRVECKSWTLLPREVHVTDMYLEGLHGSFYPHPTDTRLYSFLHLAPPHLYIWMQCSRVSWHLEVVLMLTFASPCVPCQYSHSFYPWQTSLPLHTRFNLFYFPSLLYCLFLNSTFFIFNVVVTNLVAKLFASFCLVTFLGSHGSSSLSGAKSVFLLRQWTRYSGTSKGRENISAVTIVSDGSVWYTTRDSQRYSEFGPQLSVTRWSRTINHFNTKLSTNLSYNPLIIFSLMSGFHLFLFCGLLSPSSLLQELPCSSYCSLDILEKRTVNQRILASCDTFFWTWTKTDWKSISGMWCCVYARKFGKVS